MLAREPAIIGAKFLQRIGGGAIHFGVDVEILGVDPFRRSRDLIVGNSKRKLKNSAQREICDGEAVFRRSDTDVPTT